MSWVFLIQFFTHFQRQHEYNCSPWGNSFYFIWTNKLWSAWKYLKAPMKYCYSLTYSFVSMKQDSWNQNLLLLCVARKGFFFFFRNRPWQTDGPIDWQIQADRGRADLRTVDTNLHLTSGSIKLGHLLMCVMLHNQLCQPKRVRHWLCLWHVRLASVNTLQAWWVMHQLEYPFTAKACLLESILTETLSWFFTVSPSRPFNASSSNSPSETRLGGNVHNAEIHKEWQNERLRYANVFLTATCVQRPKLLAFET